MPTSWDQVTQNPDYQALPPDQQETARQQYFNQVIYPQVPDQYKVSAKDQFDKQTGPNSNMLPNPSMGDYATDIAKGAGTGLGKGAVDLATGPFDIGAGLAAKGINAAFGPGTAQPTDVTGTIKNYLGLNSYKPTTKYGKTAADAQEAMTSFAGSGALSGNPEGAEQAFQTAKQAESANSAKSAASDLMDKILAADKTSKEEVVGKLAEHEDLSLPLTPLDGMIYTTDKGLPLTGKNALGAARAAVTTPNSEQPLWRSLALRDSDMNRRASQSVQDAIGNNNFTGELQRLQQQMKDNGINYQTAYDSPVEMDSDEIKSILGTPAGKSAVNNAERMAANERTSIYHPAPEEAPPSDAIKQTEELFGNAAVKNEGPEGAGEKGEPENGPLTTQGIDYVKRGFDQDIAKAVNGGDKQEARALTMQKNDLLAEADNLNPDFAVARQGHLEPAREADMIQQGRNWRSKNVEPEELAANLHGKESTPAEKQALATGIGRDVQDMFDRPADTSNPINSFWTQDNRNRLSYAVKPNDFADLTRQMQAEKSMKYINNWVTRGSQTADTNAWQGAIQDASQGKPSMLARAFNFVKSPKGSTVDAAKGLMDAKVQKQVEKMSPQIATELQNIMYNPQHPYWQNIGAE